MALAIQVLNTIIFIRPVYEGCNSPFLYELHAEISRISIILQQVAFPFNRVFSLIHAVLHSSRLIIEIVYQVPSYIQSL